MKIRELLEDATGGSTSSGSIATVVKGGGAGTNLLGGPIYQGSKPVGKKKKVKKESIIQRQQ